MYLAQNESNQFTSTNTAQQREMMLTCSNMIACGRSPLRTLCLASRIDTDQLRGQLQQLHHEAANTRAKADKARVRLMRLSEVAEKLRGQAIITVQAGKENDALELLFQKKKVMQALEKSKSRIELLDELSTKLNEAISLRESQLVGTVADDSEIEREDAAGPVRIVSPQEVPTENSGVNRDSVTGLLNPRDHQELQDNLQDNVDSLTDSETNDLEGSLQVTGQSLAELSTCNGELNPGRSFFENENDLISSLKGITSYDEFLDQINQELKKVETELIKVVKYSTLILEEEEAPKNIKVQQMMEILDGVQRIRERIAIIMQANLEME